ncbi:MAG: 4a-hydroxytetrahydrobiopterin dehydratase [Deltaproteobacteria bacterium]|jgi:4a-hydroxytetrahydrobiopterin dehydratase|nr:Putative pterin-4-alpha-carbinolamine dehydratase [bacterium HR37]GIW46706.1 MAG: 4a-hydroxytetrahydrobiopterin dehydratase [Deltaproteobacteria bacterium]
MPLLSENEIREKIKELKGWELKGKEISKLYNFKDFIDAVAFVNKVAILAEKANHHPDILIRYNKVTLSLSTHSEGGITEKDINLAREIDKLS